MEKMIRNPQGEFGRYRITIPLVGLRCEKCVAKCEKILEGVEGVISFAVSLEKRSLSLDYLIETPPDIAQVATVLSWEGYHLAHTDFTLTTLHCEKCIAKATALLKPLRKKALFALSLEEPSLKIYTAIADTPRLEELQLLLGEAYQVSPFQNKKEAKPKQQAEMKQKSDKETISKAPSEEEKSLDLAIHGMSCASCVATVEQALLGVKGVLRAEVNLITSSAKLRTVKACSVKSLIEAIEQAGYRAEEQVSLKWQELEQEHIRKMRFLFHRLLISGCLLLLLLLIPNIATSLALNEEIIPFLQLLVVLPVQFYCGGHFLNSAFKSIRHGNTNMDTLVTLGTLTATFSSILDLAGLLKGGIYFETTGFLITFILLGKYLEEKAKVQTSSALSKLVEMQAKDARVKQGSEWVTLPLEEVQKGDVVKIFPGEKIPVDGVVISGESYVDESSITGEPVPAHKLKGRNVYGSTLNTEGELQVEAKSVGSDSLVSRIVQVVAEAQSGKAKAQRLADKISSFFVPSIIILGICTFVVWYALLSWGIISAGLKPPFNDALLHGIAVWVIACPCALGLATPAVIMVVTGMAAEEGMLIRNITALEAAETINTIVFDKTGTLTEGKPTLTQVVTAEGMNEKEVLRRAASLEYHSLHPVALAITLAAEKRGLKLLPATNFHASPGEGVEGIVDEKQLRVCKPSLVKVQEEKLKEKIAEEEAKGNTVVLLVRGKAPEAVDPLAAFIVSDPLKENAFQVVRQLTGAKKEIVLLTGDNERTAKHIGATLGIKRVIAGVLPQEKSEHIRRLQKEGKVVAMVGDGVNDAPALACSDISFAMSSGSDVAIESADIALLRNDLNLIVKALKLSELTKGKIKQNLFWAFFYNTLGIPLAMGGYLSPKVAGAAMALSSVSVVLNSLMIKKIKF